MFSVPIKDIYRCFASLHCTVYGRIRTWHIFNTGETLFIGIEAVLHQSFYYNWKTNNKSCKIMWRTNTSLCILNIFVVCVKLRAYLHRDFTGVHESLNAMKHSIEMCLLQEQRKHRIPTIYQMAKKGHPTNTVLFMHVTYNQCC